MPQELDIFGASETVTVLSNEKRAKFPEIGITFLDQNGKSGI